MEKGARYIVKTKYGYFSLDEGSYQDYLAGKLWINWPPERDPQKDAAQVSVPANVSQEAVQLRDHANKKGVLAVLEPFATIPNIPCKPRMYDNSIYELNLTVRSSNGLMRAGVQTFGALSDLMISEGGVAGIRNLGAKSVKEIHNAFLVECYDRLLPYERAAFWQEVLDLNEKRIA
jgi:hypothetical protein